MFRLKAAAFAAAGMLTLAQAVELPAPTGEYQVGITHHHVIDESREEVFSEDEADQREFMLTLYYPAEAGESAAPYAEGALRDAIAEGMQLPAEMLDTIQTHVYADAPADERGAPYPVVLFSPGMGSLPLFYCGYLTELASHGYVVAALSHPYSTNVTIFPDGRAVYGSDQAFVLPNPDTYPAEAARVGEVWVDDALTALDTLDTLNGEHPVLAGMLDLDTIGIFGHSFGGAVAAEAAALDSRIDAGANLDGVPFGEAAANGVQQPFMFLGAQPFVYTQALADRGISEEEFERRQDLALVPRRLIFETSAAGYWLVYSDSVHNNYTSDFNTLNTAFPGLLPPNSVVDPDRMNEVVNRYLVAFFNKHLKGEDVSLLDGASSDDPEVTLEIHE